MFSPVQDLVLCTNRAGTHHAPSHARARPKRRVPISLFGGGSSSQSCTLCRRRARSSGVVSAKKTTMKRPTKSTSEECGSKRAIRNRRRAKARASRRLRALRLHNAPPCPQRRCDCVRRAPHPADRQIFASARRHRTGRREMVAHNDTHDTQRLTDAVLINTTSRSTAYL